MNCYIGIDLGTSSTKGILTDNKGTILRQCTKHYPIESPKEGWFEQSPEEWLLTVTSVLRELINGYEFNIKGISFSGQMHGLVVLDKNDRVIRPCILWNDGRSEKQTADLNKTIGKSRLSSMTGNIAFAGFTLPKLLWMKENEPENYKRIAKIMLPKDYLIYRITGVHSTDYSDASGTLLLDVKNKCWSEELCKEYNIDKKWLPALHESYYVVGYIKEDFARQLNLPLKVKVIAGAGDNAAAAIGTNTVANGSCNISLGTSGTIFISQDRFSVDVNNAIHSFAHANGKWHLLGCILSAASARKWWLENILESNDYEHDEEIVSICGPTGIIFLPYLCGERSPYNDVNVRGAFLGISLTTTRAQMSKAVMEGVAFAIRDCVEVAKSNGIDITKASLCGGGAKSSIWCQIIADVLQIPVSLAKSEHGPCFGAALLAMVGCNEYTDVAQASNACVKDNFTICPNKSKMHLYDRYYEIYHNLYQKIKDIKI